jgi:hypothetical protein
MSREGAFLVIAIVKDIFISNLVNLLLIIRIKSLVFGNILLLVINN